LGSTTCHPQPAPCSPETAWELGLTEVQGEKRLRDFPDPRKDLIE